MKEAGSRKVTMGQTKYRFSNWTTREWCSTLASAKDRGSREIEENEKERREGEEAVRKSDGKTMLSPGQDYTSGFYHGESEGEKSGERVGGTLMAATLSNYETKLLQIR